jgi:lipopolysaccharide biosynthesis glycosyltransferase
VIEQKGACGDQDILQSYYSDWPQHPELDMGEKYGIIAYYADYYEKHLGYHYTNNIEDTKSVAIIHYAGEKKPWMQHWSHLSVLKQELQLAALRLLHIRNTAAVLLEYKHLVRKARKMLYAK